MTSNPYRAPHAVVGDVASTDEEPAPPRPRVVTFTLIMGWLLLALSVYALGRFTFNFIAWWEYLHRLPAAYVQVVVRAALASYFVFMLLFLHRRRILGRWLGAIFILSFLVIPVLGIVTIPKLRDGDGVQLSAYVTAIVIMTAPTLWWFYVFTFSRKARAWFQRVPAPDAPR